MKSINIINETAHALAFLSRLPIPDRFFKDAEHDLDAQSAGVYPIAGVIIACLACVPLSIAYALDLPAALSATFTVLAMIIITGALHEDGLGDVADGFGGAATIEERLEIMKDSRLGTYGVIAVASSLILRISALTAILSSHGLIAAICALIAAAAASRGAMVWIWSALPNAKQEGVSAKIGPPPESALSLSSILALAFAAVFGLLASGLIASSVAIGLGILAMIGFQLVCKKLIGGQTGDALGASQQLVEIAMLTGLAISTA